ncbi:hypothetical protein EU546_01830 [Candidatus Thorarchaeota archaeon]|nr:MAG: hypothetical protein EU546_01830 [Candidatus Thorarchaeota archaeon]
MESGSEPKKRRGLETFDVGALFRGSATVTFVIEIVAVIVMLGAVVAFYIDELIPAISPDIQVLLLLIGSIVTLLVFLAALGVFVRFSRRISDLVIGPGIQEVPMDTPRVKTVVYIYAILVTLMAATGLYVWYLVHKYALGPWAGSSISLQIFGLALGAFFVALLIQIIVALVGRTATKVIIEVLDQDDSEFLE